MRTATDLPSPVEIEMLEQVLAAPRLDRDELAGVLCIIDRALQTHADELDQFGGLLTRDEEVARPSLAREAERLRQAVTSLAEQSSDLTETVESSYGERTIRRQAQEFLEALQRQRNREADVKLESVVTDIGAGD